MCRNIKTLFNFDPPATHAEIHASALQFVRKLSGFNSPSQANTEAFNRAVYEVSDSARRLRAKRMKMWVGGTAALGGLFVLLLAVEFIQRGMIA